MLHVVMLLVMVHCSFRTTRWIAHATWEIACQPFLGKVGLLFLAWLNAMGQDALAWLTRQKHLLSNSWSLVSLDRSVLGSHHQIWQSKIPTFHFSYEKFFLCLIWLCGLLYVNLGAVLLYKLSQYFNQKRLIQSIPFLCELICFPCRIYSDVIYSATTALHYGGRGFQIKIKYLLERRLGWESYLMNMLIRPTHDYCQVMSFGLCF